MAAITSSNTSTRAKRPSSRRTRLLIAPPREQRRRTALQLAGHLPHLARAAIDRAHRAHADQRIGEKQLAGARQILAPERGLLARDAEVCRLAQYDLAHDARHAAPIQLRGAQ